jgi:hypothetical protein
MLLLWPQTFVPIPETEEGVVTDEFLEPIFAANIVLKGMGNVVSRCEFESQTP